MKQSGWPAVKRKEAELRSLIQEQWKTGEWEIAALGERVLRTTADSKSASEHLRAQIEALQAATDSLVLIARNG